MEKVFFAIIGYLIIAVSSVNSQDFSVYYLSSRYSQDDRIELEKNKLYSKYYWVGESVLTPKRDGILDRENIIRWVDRSFPEMFDNSYLGIDIEGNVMKALRENNIGSKEFEAAKNVFIEAVEIIKDRRPNLQIGIYGLPFRIYYQNQYKGDDKKLYPILRKCDFISPALYIIYPDSYKGANRNDEYLRFNLKRSLKISNDLNIPVLPYVWPIIHPMNKKNGGQMIEINAMKRYLTLIKNFNYLGKTVSGVLWWEESSKSKHSSYNNANLPKNMFNRESSKTSKRNIILLSTEDLNQ